MKHDHNLLKMRIAKHCGASRCEHWENLATGLIASLTNLAIFPAVIQLHRQNLRFEAAIGLFGLFTSMLYHFCEPTELVILGMNGGNWHRLDNIGAIMCFANLFIYFMDNR
jgi:hypothetical protein